MEYRFLLGESLGLGHLSEHGDGVGVLLFGHDGGEAFAGWVEADEAAVGVERKLTFVMVGDADNDIAMAGKFFGENGAGEEVFAPAVREDQDGEIWMGVGKGSVEF